MNNILVTGCKGQLGSEIKELHEYYNKYNFFFTDFHDLDITCHESVISYINKNKINIIINCAAYTAVDKAESELDTANAINHLAVSNFAMISKKNNIKLIHISTDYVFDGQCFKPYTEDQKTNPNTVYGKSKLLGELAIKKINPKNSIIIRTSWLYSKFGKNFVKTILNLAIKRKKIDVVNDQFGSPTNAADLAKVILNIISLIKNTNVEVYHYSNSGACTWYDFAKKIISFSKIQTKIEKTSTKKLIPSRPKYSVLYCGKIEKKFNIKILNWKRSLMFFLKKYHHETY